MTEEAAGAAGGDVGAELARARQAAGLAVADVAQQLKFAPRQIEALEEGRYGDLPPGTFARGMVRAYARLVKLDPGPLVERIAAQVAVPDNAAAVASARRPIPIVDNARRTNLTYAALSLVILAVIGAVIFEWQRDRARAEEMTFVAAAQPPAEAPKPAPTPVASASPVSPQAAPLASEEPQEKPVPPPAVEKTAPAAAAEKTATPAGRHRIGLKFERESWVEIRNRDGKILTSQLNPAGSERTVEGLPPFEVVIGNAQHVRLSYDDQPVDLAPHVKVEVARFTLK
ncbi:MAG TPA: RodZ domain-containing protein [Burkholderiales bacterium]|jgi:cytoskeleton protein RodZ|nr:RodZ domain-containing protein [Burkholderiales bacterium]